MSAQEFNRDVSTAKRRAAAEPVVITDRGVPSRVLMSIADYEALLADRRTIVDWLSVDDDVDLPVERLDLRLDAASW